MLPVAILAGGLATRLNPITLQCPKALVEVSGKPFIHYQLNYLSEQKINNVVICIGHLGEYIRDYVGNGSQWGLEVQYSADGEIKLGTGGAIKKALPMLGEVFFVLYGDSFLPVDYKKVQNEFNNRKKSGLMTIYKNNNQWERSNVNFINGQIITYNKTHITPEMEYIDYGLGVLKSDSLHFFNHLESFDLSDLYSFLANEGQLAGYQIYSRYYEIGSHQGLNDFEKYLEE